MSSSACDRFSSDALHQLLTFLPVQARLHLARVDQQCFELGWNDVDRIKVNEGSVTIIGLAVNQAVSCNTKEKTTELVLERLWTICPIARRLMLDVTNCDKFAAMVEKKQKTVRTLYISTTALNAKTSTIQSLKFNNLRSLGVFSRDDQLDKLNWDSAQQQERLLPMLVPTLYRLSLTGVALTPAILDAILKCKRLQILELIGCLVDSKVGASFVPRLKELDQLDTLSVPPAMFSFSMREKNQIDFSFKTLTNLKNLSFYMETFDAETYKNQLENFLPKTLQTLTMYGNTMKLRKSEFFERSRFKLICPSNVNRSQANFGANRLLSHFVWTANFGSTPINIEKWFYTSPVVEAPQFTSKDISDKVEFTAREPASPTMAEFTAQAPPSPVVHEFTAQAPHSPILNEFTARDPQSPLSEMTAAAPTTPGPMTPTEFTALAQTPAPTTLAEYTALAQTPTTPAPTTLAEYTALAQTPTISDSSVLTAVGATTPVPTVDEHTAHDATTPIPSA